MTTRGPAGDQIDQVFARSIGGTVSWYLPDHLGSTRAIVNNSGSTIATLTYDSFGNLTSAAGPARSPRPSPHELLNFSTLTRRIQVEGPSGDGGLSLRELSLFENRQVRFKKSR